MRAISILSLALLALCACNRPAASSGPPASASAPAVLAALDASTNASDAAAANAAESSDDASAPLFTGNNWPSLIAVTDAGIAVRDALVARDMHRLAGLVHPTRGVRFSPYAYIDTKADVVLHANEIEAAFASSKTRTWGSFDGSGDPIVLTFRAYVARFVVFSRLGQLAPRLNGTVAAGNTTNNQREVYGDAPYVEFYAPDEGANMNWEALRIVLEPVNGKLYVVGIVHDVWTI